ncbi:hypothetical protein BDY17DRAFT_297637 [Neohortaea acidophila]|uniref:Uncharacterized protein n=1 Tax=Neohortaea acidophila TaxID=245834 RepID=A0A6A6PU02_9PEZI|nr:uncharacterized protein BDY17DRAFT_297637 [Neohortaea acidophila]KAF2483570.1 hypothetical protein BDY17DRAFT_297637 [Neohortaea acidophila]
MIPDTDTSGALQHLTRVLDSMRSAKEVKEAKEEMERVKPELDRWSEEQTVLQQQIDDQLRALDDLDMSDVQKVKDRLEAIDEMLKEQRLGTPRDHNVTMRWSHAILRMCRAWSDCADARADCLPPGEEICIQKLSDCGENARRELARASTETEYGKTREEWARQYELAQNEASTASQKKEDQDECQSADHGGGQLEAQHGGQIDGGAEDVIGSQAGGNSEAHVADHSKEHTEGHDGTQVHDHGGARAEDHGVAQVNDSVGQREKE